MEQLTQEQINEENSKLTFEFEDDVPPPSYASTAKTKWAFLMNLPKDKSVMVSRVYNEDLLKKIKTAVQHWRKQHQPTWDLVIAKAALKDNPDKYGIRVWRKL